MTSSTQTTSSSPQYSLAVLYATVDDSGEISALGDKTYHFDLTCEQYKKLNAGKYLAQGVILRTGSTPDAIQELHAIIRWMGPQSRDKSIREGQPKRKVADLVDVWKLTHNQWETWMEIAKIRHLTWSKRAQHSKKIAKKAGEK